MSDEKLPPLEKGSFGRSSFDDADGLRATGHIESLSRKFSLWSMLGFAFVVLATWETFAVDLSNGLNNGGPITILYGLILVTLCNICIALSFGELCSSMPTAMGQAYWVSRLWKSSLGRFASYSCAWINVIGWLTLSAAQNAFIMELLLATKTVASPSWAGGSKAWLQFIVYVGVSLVLTAINVVACRKDWILHWLNSFSGVYMALLFVLFLLALVITVGVKGDLSFQPGSFMFGQWLNDTGWSDGVTWFMGLVQSAYGLTAFDAVIHMIEELPSPQTNGPKVLWMSVVTGAVTGWLFMVASLLCIQNLQEMLNPPSGLPFVALLKQTMGATGTVALLAIFVASLFTTGIGNTTTASRLVWGFARDGGLPFSNYLKHTDPYWKVPVRAV